MKTIFTKLISAAFLIVSFNLSAQWSEIGGAGFTSGGSSRNCMAVSGSTLYMAYTDGASMVTVMKSTGSTWSVVGTPSIGGVAVQVLDMAVDNSGVPHVVFQDGSSNLHVMKWNGTIWTSVGSATFTAAWAGQDIGIAFDNTNAPNVAFSENAVPHKASVMKFNGTSWVYVGATGFSAGQTQYVTIAKSPSTGALYVAYSDNASLNWATVMTFNGTAWALVGTAGGASQGSQAIDQELAVSNTGVPHVIYADFPNSNRATVRAFNGTSWAVVGSQGFSAGSVSSVAMTFNSAGTAYVAFRDAGVSNRASSFMFNGSAWTNVGTAGFSGGTANSSNILFNSAGQPCVGYQDASVSNRATVMKYCTSATGSVLSVSGGTTCGNGSVTISGTATPGTIYWYNAPTNGSYITSNSTFTAWCTSTLSYYAAAVDANGCVSPIRTQVTASSVPYPTVTAAMSATTCTGNSAVISATPSAGTINWYSVSVAGTTLSTGLSYTTPVLNSATTITYYAEAISQGCWTYPRTAITVTVRPTPTVNIGGVTTICSGNSTTLSMSGSGVSSYTWSTGVSTSTISVTPSVTTTYSIFATHFQGCSATKTVQVTVSPCTGINELNNGTSFSVYPNPNSGEFTLNVPEHGTYFIINSVGQTIERIEIKEDQQTINVGGLAEGIYYVMGRNARAKIVVSR